MRRQFNPVSCVAILAVLALCVGGVAAEPTPFAKIGGDQPAARALPDKPNTDLALAVSPAEARRRVDAFLTAEGFAANDASKSPTAVSYVRFADREGFREVADCHGPAVGTAKLWLETVVVDVQPAAAGARVTATGQFQIILNSLVSGSPFKMACRSRGQLEAQVRDALAKE